MTAEPEASELVPEPEATGWSVLVVEDNVFTQKLMLRWLEARGCTARVAGHGQEALEMLTHEGTRATVDLVLLDLCMPVMDGLVMAQQLRAAERLHNWMRMPLLAVTALTGDEERQRALEAGIDGFHSKPIQSDALFTEMTRLMSERDGTSPEDEEARHGVDVAYALRVMEGDWELFQEVVGLYLTDAPKHIERMREAVYAGDASALREAAHTLKGASSAFGKNSRVHELALTLEQIGRQGGDISRADPLCRDLVSAFELLRQGLQETLDGCVTE
jgi:CheY-like chemotaxis protein